MKSIKAFLPLQRWILMLVLAGAVAACDGKGGNPNAPSTASSGASESQGGGGGTEPVDVPTPGADADDTEETEPDEGGGGITAVCKDPRSFIQDYGMGADGVGQGFNASNNCTISVVRGWFDVERGNRKQQTLMGPYVEVSVGPGEWLPRVSPPGSWGSGKCEQGDIWWGVTKAQLESGELVFLTEDEGKPGWFPPMGSWYTGRDGDASLCAALPEPPKEKEPEPPLTCADFDAPVLSITGQPYVSLGEAFATISQGTIGPNGVVFNPALSFDVEIPEYDEAPAPWSFTATFTEFYGPEELACSVEAEKTFDGVIEPKEGRCDQINPPSFEVDGPHVEPFTPASTTSYWRMLQGSDNARENACVNRGGEWLNTEVFLPVAGFGFYPDVCLFEDDPAPPGNPGNDMTLYDPPGIIVNAAEGVKVSATVTFFHEDSVFTVDVTQSGAFCQIN